MVVDIGPNIVFVSGAARSAIYDFRTGKVYSINELGSEIIKKAIANGALSDDDENFLNSIKEMFALDAIGNTCHIFESIRPALDFVWLEITNRCNCKCVHCYTGDTHIEENAPLSFHDWQRIITEIGEIGCKRLCFIGGEPSLYERLPELLDHTGLVGIEAVSVYTNLRKISDELLNAIIRNNVQVKFSIYGSNASVHDTITQVQGSFDDLMQNLALLLKHGISAYPGIVMMRENEHDILNIETMLSSLGISSWKCDEIRVLREGSQSSHVPLSPHFLLTSPNFSTSRSSFERAHGYNTCWCGKLAVAYDGMVLPCVFERCISYGDLKTSSLSDILLSEELNKWWGLSYAHLEPCKECEYRFACRDCRPIATSMGTKKSRCLYDPIRGIWGN